MPLPDHISARHEDLDMLVAGMIALDRHGRPGGVEPAGALAQLAGQGVPRVLAGAQGNGEPVERARIEMAETDLA